MRTSSFDHAQPHIVNNSKYWEQPCPFQVRAHVRIHVNHTHIMRNLQTRAQATGNVRYCAIGRISDRVLVAVSFPSPAHKKNGLPDIEISLQFAVIHLFSCACQPS